MVVKECNVSLAPIYTYTYLVIFVKRQRSTHNSPWYILYIKQPTIYLRILSKLKKFNVNNGPEGDLGWTTRIILTAAFCKINKGSIFVLHTDSQNLITIYHVRIFESVAQTFQRFTTEYFAILDYNPYTTSDLSTHKWYMIFPTQFTVNNHTK